MDDFQLYKIELEAIDISNLFENPGTVHGEAPRAPFAITSITRAADGRSVESNLEFPPRTQLQPRPLERHERMGRGQRLDRFRRINHHDYRQHQRHRRTHLFPRARTERTEITSLEGC
jgi:hypothetical protein